MTDESEYIPGKKCKKGHPTIKRYANGGTTCTTCAPAARKDREKKIREGNPSQTGRCTKQEMREKKMHIATMGGAAIAPEVIAREVGLNQDRVEQILRKDVKNDAELLQLFKDAERTLAPKAYAAADKLLTHIAKVAEGYDVVVGKDKDTGNPIIQHVDTAPHHAAAALREMRPFIGMGDRPVQGDPSGGVRDALSAAMTKDPAVAAAVVTALIAARDKKRLAERSAG